MGKTKIEWCNYTFNPWVGCAKVSPGCAHCYAETWAKRTGFTMWGDNPRRITSDNNWSKLQLWNDLQNSETPRQTVFVASLTDVFEDRPEILEPRQRLFAELERLDSLIYLILTKRPENILDMIPNRWRYEIPRHIWMGVSIESADYLTRLDSLGSIPASRFVSIEPMLGPVDLKQSRCAWAISWIICGGESGPRARPMQLDWASALADQCKNSHIPFFMKQLGGHPDKRNDIKTFPPTMQIREFPDWD